MARNAQSSNGSRSPHRAVAGQPDIAVPQNRLAGTRGRGGTQPLTVTAW